MAAAMLAAALWIANPLAAWPCLADVPDGGPAGELGADKEAAVEDTPPPAVPVTKLFIRGATSKPRWLTRDTDLSVRFPVFNSAVVVEGLEDDLQAESLRQEMEALLRPALHAEVYFVHLVCETSRQERQRLLAAIEPELSAAAFAAARRRVATTDVVVGDFAVARVGPPEDYSDQINTLRDRLVDIAEQQLGERRGEVLRHEMRQRVDMQRRVTIRNIIAALDDLLVLSAQQKQDLMLPLLNGWNDQWKLFPAHWHEVDYFPRINLPLAAEKVFSADQRSRWLTVSKVRFSGHEAATLQPIGLPDRWKAVLEHLDQAEQAGEIGQ